MSKRGSKSGATATSVEFTYTAEGKHHVFAYAIGSDFKIHKIEFGVTKSKKNAVIRFKRMIRQKYSVTSIKEIED